MARSVMAPANGRFGTTIHVQAGLAGQGLAAPSVEFTNATTDIQHCFP
jgi:hypothetical protein